MIQKILQLYRCTRHVPPRQLVRRGWLNLKRAAISGAPTSLRPSLPARPFQVAKSPPVRLMPPRKHLISPEGNSYQLTHLGGRFPLTSPVDWNLDQTPGATHLQRLAIHYHEFIEALPVDASLSLILDWIDAQPCYQIQYWQTSWNSYALSIRCLCWMQWLAEHRDQITSDASRRIVASLSAQLRFLVHNLETDIGGNHLLKDLSCLLWAGAFFDDPETEKYATQAERLLESQLNVQFLEDGCHYELSPAYHCQVFVDLLQCFVALQCKGRGVSAIQTKLSAAAQAIADLTHPDGLISLFSDAGLNMAYTPADCLTAFRDLTGSAPKPQSTFSYPTAGYFGIRTSHSYLVIDCGPLCADALPAHGHGDMLAFEWDVSSQRFIVDKGVFEYEPGPLRKESRTALSHNTLTVGDRDQAEFIGSFRVGRRSHCHCDVVQLKEGELFLEGSHKAYSSEKTITHRRRFEARDGSVRVNDQVDGGVGLEVISRLLLHDECEIIEASERTLRIKRAEVTVRLTTTAQIEVIDSTWFPDFGVAKKTKQVLMHYGRAPCQHNFELLLE